MTNNDYQQIRPWLEGVLTTRGLPCKFEEDVSPWLERILTKNALPCKLSNSERSESLVLVYRLLERYKDIITDSTIDDNPYYMPAQEFDSLKREVEKAIVQYQIEETSAKAQIDEHRAELVQIHKQEKRNDLLIFNELAICNSEIFPHVFYKKR